MDNTKVKSGKWWWMQGGFTLLLIMWRGVYPGFPTDLQSRLWQFFSQFPEKAISEKMIFEARYKEGRNEDMGAHIQSGKETFH